MPTTFGVRASATSCSTVVAALLGGLIGCAPTEHQMPS